MIEVRLQRRVLHVCYISVIVTILYVYAALLLMLLELSFIFPSRDLVELLLLMLLIRLHFIYLE